MVQLLLLLALLGLAVWFLFPAVLMGTAMGVGAVAWVANAVARSWPYLAFLAAWVAGFFVIARVTSNEKALGAWFATGPLMVVAYVLWIVLRG